MEKRIGNIKIIAAGKSVEYHVKTGLLPPHEVERMKKRIERIME